MTDIPEQPANRLDRIEAILAIVATQQSVNTQAIAQFDEKINRIADKLFHI